MQYDIVHITSLFENATEGFVVSDKAGRIILVNPAACRMFGYGPDELVGQKIEVLIPSRYKEEHVGLRNGFYDHPKNRVMGHGRDLHGQMKDGSIFPVEVSLSTYVREGMRYVISFIVDITHRKIIEQDIKRQQKELEDVSRELSRLNAELEIKVQDRTMILEEALQKLEQSQEELSEALDKERQLNEIKSNFVSMASHEFRTPLSTVLSSASLLSKYTSSEDQPRRDRHIQKIKDSVKHLNDLLEDFLSLGKLNEGKMDASFQELNLPELVSDTLEELRPLARKGQQLEYHHHGTQVMESDKRLIRNIVINLVSNAFKFSEEDTPISVQSEISNGLASVCVKDEGIGISEEDKEHLFSSFFRGRNAINIQGTGLGLHIVKRYLDLLGGNIELESELGKGTSIRVSLPVKHISDGKNSIGH